MLQSLSDEPKVKDVSTIIKPQPVEQISPDEPQDTKDKGFVGGIKNGVEVVDVKAIEKKKPKLTMDKFGIPIQPGEHRNFDRI